MTSFLLDTTFLIDLERETSKSPAAAHRFLESHPEAPLYLTVTIAGELAGGESLADRDRWRRLLSAFRVLPVTEDVAWRYGTLYRFLKTNGLLIGSNDLWIASAALAHGLPLVTRNRRHFQRVPGLEVVGY